MNRKLLILHSLRLVHFSVNLAQLWSKSLAYGQCPSPDLCHTRRPRQTPGSSRRRLPRQCRQQGDT